MGCQSERDGDPAAPQLAAQCDAATCVDIQQAAKEDKEISNHIGHSSLEFNSSFIPDCVHYVLSSKFQRALGKIDRCAVHFFTTFFNLTVVDSRSLFP